MQLFNTNEPRLTLTEISKRLAMPTSTAYNLLSTLLHEGFLEKVDDDAYALGTQIISLTQHVRVNVEVRDRAAQLLRELADRSGESVYLTIKDDDLALYIYAIESSHRLQARTAIGDRVQLHCTAVGKAMLALLPDDEVAGIIERGGLPAYTPNTLTDQNKLLQDLAQTRERGFSMDAEEHEQHTYCLGAPFFDMRGRVIGACSLSGADPQILGDRVEELSSLVVYTAHEISRRMGFVPNTMASWAHVAHMPAK